MNCKRCPKVTYLVLFALIGSVIGNNAPGPESRSSLADFRQESGYITVRPDAHMFWWLFRTAANVSNFADRPLIIWLQGGPGMPSSGFGNFYEIGPLDLEMRPRSGSWIRHFNVLFVDNPVGVGYSYFDNNQTNFVTNNEEIGRDLVVFAESFLKSQPEFQEVPLYVFGESYGGKMAVEFAVKLTKKIKLGEIRANFRGIGLVSAYISPIDYATHYASFGLNLGLIDKHGYHAISKYAKQMKAAVKEDRFLDASKTESTMTAEITTFTNGIDFYNIAFKCNATSLPVMMQQRDAFTFLMNNKVKEFLDIPEHVEWDFMNYEVYENLFADFIRPVTSQIEHLLNNTDLKVIVYSGVFDYIVNTPGTAQWLSDLNWRGKERWNKEQQRVLQIDQVNEGYVKQVDNLIFYTILRAGHSVPTDNPAAMEETLLRELLNITEPIL